MGSSGSTNGFQEMPALQREAAGLVVCSGHKMEELKAFFKHHLAPGSLYLCDSSDWGPSLAKRKAHKESKVMFVRDDSKDEVTLHHILTSHFPSLHHMLTEEFCVSASLNLYQL